MTEISVSLVRKYNGAKEVEELLNINTIYLNGLNIEVIDNLEVFNQIKELYLSGNNIKSIDNVEFLESLELLDLSYNEIETSSLENGMKKLPKSLKLLNISGNPCAEDESSLEKLREFYPKIALISNSLKEEADIGPEQADTIEPVVPTAPTHLDSDVLLKEIVQRKCKLQSLELPDAKSFENEINDMVKDMEGLLASKREDRAVRQSARMLALESKNTANKEPSLPTTVFTESGEEFLKRLRQKAFNLREELSKPKM